jgi:hypothetical protein
LGLDQEFNSLIYVIKPTYQEDRMVMIFNGEYNLTDEILLADSSNRYYWILPPFLRADGILYEFRVLDEGLEIIRWSKE